MVFSKHNAYMKMPLSYCVEDCSNDQKSQVNLNFYILPSDKQRCRRWLQASGRVQQHLSFLHSLFWLTVCNLVLWQNPIKPASNIPQTVFNSFYRTVTHGESHRVFTSSQHSNGVSQHFTQEARNKPRRHMNSVVNN